MLFLSRLFSERNHNDTAPASKGGAEAEQRAEAILDDAEALLTDVLAAVPWPLPEVFSERGRAILGRIEAERNAAFSAARGARAATELCGRDAVDAECAALVAQIRATRTFDPEHASRVATERLRALGVEVPGSYSEGVR